MSVEVLPGVTISRLQMESPASIASGEDAP